MDITPKLLGIKEVCEYTGLKRSKAITTMEEIGAKRKIGKRALYDKETIDRYVDSLAPKKEG